MSVIMEYIFIDIKLQRISLHNTN